MTTRKFHLISRMAGLLVALGLCSGAALAGAADDYEEGAKLYGNGDLVAAMRPLRQSADAGHAAAQAMLAEILARADSGEEAVDYYRKAAAQGNADGEFGFGAMLAAGEGIAKDVAAGRTWILRAAEQGHKAAINELALAYIKGNLDIADNERQGAEALRWVRKSAENGFLPAMEKMAAASRAGELGLTVDARAASQWDEKIRQVLGQRQGRRGNKRSNANEPARP